MQQKLWSFLTSEIERAQKIAARRGYYLAGVEQEFFLLAEDGLPCTIEQSQMFLRQFGESPSAKVYMDAEAKITKVGIDRQDGSYGSLKYDHEPHLLEYASSYHNNLKSLDEELTRVFTKLESLGERLGLLLVQKPTIEISPENPRTRSQSPEFINLRTFRRKIQTSLGLENINGADNYAAVVAATQVNISLEECIWSKKAEFIPNLYSYECAVLPYATLFTGPDVRWKHYRSTYSGYALVGFPNLKEWSFETWLNACLDCYVFQKNETDLFTLRQLVERDPNNLSGYWKYLRDLQIVRPKATGAIEFRADPCQESIRQVLALAALRLGICLICASKTNISENPMANRDDWWRSVESTAYKEPDAKLLSAVRSKLDEIDPSASKYLAPYFERIESDVA